MSRPVVFVSYSSKNTEWKTRFVKHLDVLEKQGLLEVWTDSDIGFGEKWLKRIEEAASRSVAAVLLITSEFLSSEFILDKEIPLFQRLAQQYGLRILPVIVRPSPWTKVSWLAEIEVRPREDVQLKRTKGQPISETGDTELQERLLKDVAEEVLEVVQAARRRTGSHRVFECPDLLPFTCDRVVQVDELQAALRPKAPSAPTRVACLVHGDELACHDQFLEVIKRYDLPKILELGNQMNVRPLLLEWPKRSDSYEAFKTRLMGRLTREYGEPDTLNLHPGPLLAHAHLLSRDLRPQSVEYFVKFWDEWPARPPGKRIVACLCVKYVPAVRGIMRLFRSEERENEAVHAGLERQAATAGTPSIECLLLPRLDDIERGDAETWARRPEVTRFRPGVDLVGRVGAVYSVQSDRPIPMQPLANKLKLILEAPD